MRRGRGRGRRESGTRGKSRAARTREHKREKTFFTPPSPPLFLSRFCFLVLTFPQVVVPESRDLGRHDDLRPVLLGQPGGYAAVRVSRGLLGRGDRVDLGRVEPVDAAVKGVRELLKGVLGVVLLASPRHGAEAAGCVFLVFGILFF